MKQLNKSIFVLTLVLSFFSSCEKVIELDIDDANKRIIIEANLSDGNQQFEVLISENSAYNEQIAATPIDGASVLLKDDLGNAYPVPFVGSGKYSTALNVATDHLYTLEVNYNNTTYSANSYLNSPVTLDGITTDYKVNFFTQEEGYIVSFQYLDPAGSENFYRLKIIENGVALNDPTDLRIFKDAEDGVITSRTATNTLFSSGDNLLLEFIHIDEASYNYYASLGDIIGSSNIPSPTPSNPVSNWNNNALGAFIAGSSDTLSILVP